MAKFRVYNLGSLNLKVSPFLLKDGDMIRCINMKRDSLGALKKRPGYTTYLGTGNGSIVDNLWNWTQNDGTTFWNYRASGGVIQYSTQGTGAWTICGNGTMTVGAPVFNAVTENTMLVADGTAATRHTTNGTSFTNTSSAPIARALVDYQNRIYALGTASTLFWSNAGTPTDWTNDSSSINIPGPGRLHVGFKQNDRLVVTKNSGIIYKWDGFDLIDLATKLGPTSPLSVAEVEDFRFYLNRLGEFGYGGQKPELISNPIERQIYNDSGSAIIGTTFDNASGVTHQYNYYLSVGTVTDDLTSETIPDCIFKYDYQQNEYSNYAFAHRPTTWLSYKDASGNQQLIFANGSQCYTLGGTVTDDSGSTIESTMEGVLTFGAPESDKKYNYIWASANPGCEAHVQVAISDTFTKGAKTWLSLGQFKDGIAEMRFPQGSRGKLLFWKVTEASRNARFQFYGFTVDAEVIDRT